MELRSCIHDDRTPLENRLPAVLKYIQKRSDERRKFQEQLRREQEENQRRREQLERQRERVAKYDAWVGALELMQHRVRAHTEQSGFVTALESRAEQETDEDKRRHLKAFIAWAQEHLESVDPLRNPPIPVEEPPDMSYAEWAHWRERFDGRNGRGPRP
jgi:TolA-binding protein